MGSNTYKADRLNYKRGDLIKTTLSYAHKATGKGNDIVWSRVLYFQFNEVGNSCTIQQFFNIYIESVINKFKLIQSSVVRWNSIKVESVNQTSSNVIQYPLTGIYGTLSTLCDAMKGFQIDLSPSKGSATKRIYIRGVPDVLNIFDHDQNPELRESVQAIERTFIEILGKDSITKDQKTGAATDGCSFRFVVPSTLDTAGFETVGSSSAIKLHLFKKRATPDKNNSDKNKRGRKK